MAQEKISARAQEERHHAVRAELLARLRPICESMPNDIFLEMIESMTVIKLKYEMRGA